MQFPLYKLFLVLAAYALALGVLSPLGSGGIVLGMLIGTEVSAIILISRKGNLDSIVAVAFGSLLGAAIGACCLGQPLMAFRYGYDHGFGETERSMIQTAMFGAAVGGVAASLLLKRNRPK